jgi:hypothetical protein
MKYPCLLGLATNRDRDQTLPCNCIPTIIFFCQGTKATICVQRTPITAVSRQNEGRCGVEVGVGCRADSPIKFLMYRKCLFEFNYSVFENFCAANEFCAKHGQHCLAHALYSVTATGLQPLFAVGIYTFTATRRNVNTQNSTNRHERCSDNAPNSMRVPKPN